MSKIMVVGSACALALVFASARVQAADAPVTNPVGTVKRVAGFDSSGKEIAQIDAYGSRIRVFLGEVPAEGKLDVYKLVPYLDGHAFKGTYPVVANTKENFVEFKLPDKYSAKAEWRPILRGPPLEGGRRVTVSVGPDDGRQWLPADYKNPPGLEVRLFPGWWLVAAALLVLMGVALGRLAARSAILRDSTPKPSDPGKLPPFSLAKTQAAVWFFLVFAAFVFIWLMTGDYNGVITTNVLALIGIGSGTTLGAAMIEAARSEQWQKDRAGLQKDLDAEKANLAAASGDPAAQARITQNIESLEQRIRPASRGLILDLLTDVNGITLHRFQMLVWTISLGIVFVAGVYEKLAMPDFDATLLALMGISSGVYLGFKIPEKQT